MWVDSGIIFESYTSRSVIDVLICGKLAGKSRDQVNRDIKARRLLSLTLGNRDQRIPDWQLDPLRHKLVLAVLKQFPDVNSWRLYRTVCEPHGRLKGCSLIDGLTMDNFEFIADCLQGPRLEIMFHLRELAEPAFFKVVVASSSNYCGHTDAFLNARLSASHFSPFQFY